MSKPMCWENILKCRLLTFLPGMLSVKMFGLWKKMQEFKIKFRSNIFFVYNNNNNMLLLSFTTIQLNRPFNMNLYLLTVLSKSSWPHPPLLDLCNLYGCISLNLRKKSFKVFWLFIFLILSFKHKKGTRCFEGLSKFNCLASLWHFISHTQHDFYVVFVVKANLIVCWWFD